MFCIVVLRVVSLLLVCVILFGFCVCFNGFYNCLGCVRVIIMTVVIVVCV